MAYLVEKLAALGVEDPAGKASKLLGYRDALLEKNKFINLTAITDPEEFVERHFIDSLAPLGHGFYENASRVADLGTGGGFPGVPLAVCSPDKEFVLIDSLAKRLAVIDELCAGLGITNVRTVHGRAEDVGRMKEYREAFDLCVSRAVADLSVLAEYCIPLVRIGGSFCAYKSYPVAEELERAGKAIRMLGGGAADIPYVVQGSSEKAHCLVVIGKAAHTSGKYPRRAGTPSTKPIK